jgi:large subunit ribosomal protein L28
MSRRCQVTGKGVQSGNNVSHANNKTRRRFLPNIQETSVYSEALGRQIRVKVSTKGLKTIEHNGGIDAWLLSIAPSKLDADLRPIRAQVEKAAAKKKAAAK